VRDETRGPDDRVGNDCRVAGGGGRERAGERPGEHERLVLQDRVEQPEGAQRQLEPAARVRGFPACRHGGAVATRPEGIAGAGAAAASLALSGDAAAYRGAPSPIAGMPAKEPVSAEWY